MTRSAAIALLPVLSACALAGASTRVLPPLQDEGELYVTLQPGAAGEFTGAEALRADDTRVPLEVRGEAAAAGVQRLVAEGRLQPGSYGGIALQARGAKDPVPIPAPFEIAPRRAVVLAVSRRPGGALFAAVPPRAIVALSGYVSDGGSQDLAVFDKHQRELNTAVPTGRGPWGIALDPVQNRAYVALEGEDQIAVVDLASGGELARIRLALGDSPRELLLLPDRHLLVSANAGSNTVSFLDPARMIETARVAVGEEPVSLLRDRLSGRVYVFNARSNSISAVDPATRAVAATAATDNTPLRGQIDRAGGRLYVASTASPYLAVFALPALTLQQRVYVGLGTTSIKVDPDTDFLYVANADGRVSVFDPFSLLPVDQFDAGGAATWMAIDAAENVLFLLLADKRSVAAVQLTTRTFAGGFDTGLDPRVLVLMGERN